MTRKYLLVGLFVAAAVLMLPIAFPTAAATWRHFNAYAPPNYWSDGVVVASHMGSATYTIRAEAVGDTKIFGLVAYWDSNGEAASRQFVDSVTIMTGDVVGQVTVSFKGVPLGSAVRGSISP